MYGFHTTLDKIPHLISIGATAAQIMTGSPRSYNCKLYETSLTEPIKNLVETSDFFLINHSPYVLNFCRRDMGPGPVNCLTNHMINGYQLGCAGTILHMPKNSQKYDKDTALRNMSKNLQDCLDNTKNGHIILENMTGGSSMCCLIKEMGEFWDEYVDESMRKRISWCLDTAHLWGVGEYDLGSRRCVDQMFCDWNHYIGMDHLTCFHFNDSKVKLGGKADRHADITSGEIAPKGLKHIFKYCKKYQLPMIMEVKCDAIPLLNQLEIVSQWDKEYKV